MASYSAIANTCEAVIRLLRASYVPALFNDAALDFQVYVADNFQQPMDQGVSLLLYRVYHDGNQRTAPGRVVSGRRQRPMLALDLHFLLTAWARSASRQHEIAGWMIRVLEDNPTLPPNLLNAYRPDVFGPGEAVEVTLGELSTEDLFRIWEVMINHVYQLSIPYVARTVLVESSEFIDEHAPVQWRVVTMGPLEPLGARLP